MEITTESRKGRFYEIADWKTQYSKKLVSPEEAVLNVRDGDSICMGGGANVPKGFETALAKMSLKRELKSIDVTAAFTIEGNFEYMKPEYKNILSASSFFFGAERGINKQGNLQFFPIHLGDLGRLLTFRKPRIVSITCSPPDENGWMSRSLWGAMNSRETYQNPSCEILVITINKKMPYLSSEGQRHLMVHVSEADYIIEDDYDFPEVIWKESTQTETDIANNIAELIDDGTCIQFGQGGLADAIGKNLVYAKKKDLGIQTEVASSCVVDLVKAGVINNSRKNTYKGKSVASFVVGDKDLWKFCNHNKDIVFFEIDWVNDPYNICKNDNVVSINNAMEIDLTGQVASEAIGPTQYTGTGGQLQWVLGSQMSKNGKSIIAINSVYKDKMGNLQTKIKPHLPLGSIVSTPRSCVQYVATEFGIANLKYRGVKERAAALISIAHPDFRDALRFEAKKLGLL